MSTEVVPKGHLVVLDDDELVGATLGMIAEHAGFETTVTTRFDEFWQVLGSANVTHVAVDLSMPEVDGIEVLRRLAEADFAGAVIISSGTDLRMIETARRSGREQGLHVAGTLPKPFGVEDVHALLGAEPPSKR